MKLPKSFFNRETKTVAKELLGKHIINKVNGYRLSAKIVETEAYLQNDPACHASKGLTPRNKVMFGQAGHVYVYFSYGNHWLLNFVTEQAGIPGAVLIRAVEPIKGIEVIKANRPKAVKDIDLTNGPGKVGQALGLDKSYYGLDLTDDKFYVEENGSSNFQIVQTTRIGISQGRELPYRFYIKDNQFVSRR